jgi:hypothetical protein
MVVSGIGEQHAHWRFGERHGYRPDRQGLNESGTDAA